MSKRFWYFYICDDCGEAIQQRLDTIKNFQNVICRTCSNRRKGKENRDKISETIKHNWSLIPKDKRIELTMRMRTDESKEKRVAILKQKYANGELHAWNEGNNRGGRVPSR